MTAPGLHDGVARRRCSTSLAPNPGTTVSISRPRLRDPIKPQQLAPFALRLVTELVQRPARQRHQAQQQEDALDAVKALGQLVER